MLETLSRMRWLGPKKERAASKRAAAVVRSKLRAVGVGCVCVFASFVVVFSAVDGPRAKVDPTAMDTGQFIPR